MKKIMTRLMACMLAVLLLLGSVSVAAAPQADTSSHAAAGTQPTQLGVDEYTEPTDIDSFQQVASGDGATLFADMRSGKIALRNDNTGFIWYNTPNDRLEDMVTIGSRGMELDSALVVGYVNIENEARVAGASYAYSKDAVTEGAVQVSRIDNGIRVVYDFNSIGFRIPVEYMLDNGTLVTSVPIGEILTEDAFVEAKRQEGWTDEDEELMLPSYLVSLWLNPSLGAQNSSQSGYIFVPDGSGALVDFRVGYDAPDTLYDKQVYGEEMAQTIQSLKTYEQDIHMPVFGTVVGQDALCGIIEAGDEISSILAYGSSEDCAYTGISCRLQLRDLYTSYLYQGTNNEREVKRVSTNQVTLDTYRVRYTMLAGEDADYMGMAELYRGYLVKEKGLTKRETQAALNLDLIGCAETDANFLGFTYKKKLALTTFGQAEQILEELQDAGVQSIATRLLGWTNNGVTNRAPSVKAKPLSKLGGKKAFLSLAEKAAAAGAFYPEQDMLTFQKSGSGISARKLCVKTAFGLPAYQYTYLYSVLTYDNTITPSRLMSAAGLEIVAEKFKKNYDKLHVRSLSLDTLTNYCYSDFGKNGLYRDEMVDVYTNILEDYSADMALEGSAAHAYTFPYLTRVLDIPLDSSQYDFFDQEVPFYSLVLHGYMALAGGNMNRSYDAQLSFLKSVETGSELHYLGMYEDSAVLKDTDSTDYYSTTYTLWMEQAVSFWKSYKPLLEKIQNSTITAYDELTDHVVRTVYENGVTVYVNYGEQDYTAADGTVVGADSFAYTGGAQG